MIDELFIYAILALVLVVPAVVYFSRMRRREARALAALEKGKLFSERPPVQHPSIDLARCIGCGTCVSACPEGDVLAIVAGRAAIVNGHKCIGHALCAEACPVGAITMTMGDPSVGADIPHLSAEYETNIPGMFVVGELGGLALIRNAVNQGRECIDTIVRRLAADRAAAGEDDPYDVCVVGAGPAGISASLRAIEKKLSYITLEQDEIGGTVAKYPRQKLVMTSPVEFPMYGRFRKLEISKENLMEFWQTVFRRADFKVLTGEKVEHITREPDATFRVRGVKGEYRARTVILALGRRGTPRKLGILGEGLPKVMYSLIEAESYTDKKILVVGGGDSAVEAAMGLAHQPGNTVTLSYRKDAFARIKERNSRKIEEFIRAGKIRVLFNSNPVEIREGSVLLDVQGTPLEMPNDFVWVFAGGTPPRDFLQKVGVVLGREDFTRETHDEAQRARSESSQPILPS